MKTYKDVYKFPLQDPWYNRVKDSSGNFVFQFEIDNEDNQKLLLQVINGDKTLENPELDFYHKDGYIKNHDGIKIILIRGWGNLVGSLKLSEEEAANVQDTFAEYIVEQLNKRL